MNKILFLALLLGLGLSSCEEDFDLSAPYEELTVVYGLLNSSDSVQYIRIQKGFLTNGNAFEAAGISDSIYYGDILDVKLETVGGGPVFNLQRVDGRDYGIYKDPGSFAHEPNILYRMSGRLDSLKSYRLKIRNTQNGHEAEARTGLVGGFDLAYPRSGVRFPMSVDGPIEINWSNAVNSGTYDVIVRLYYREYARSGGALLKDTFTDVVLAANYIPAKPNAGEITDFTFEKRDFYFPLSEQLEAREDIDREVHPVKGIAFIFNIGGDELARYVSSRQAQTGLVQNEAVPLYTNVSGGVGILSSRLPVVVSGVSLDDRALDTLRYGQYTRNLRFR